MKKCGIKEKSDTERKTKGIGRAYARPFSPPASRVGCPKVQYPSKILLISLELYS